jgi:UDP-glucose 4-epimerase
MLNKHTVLITGASGFLGTWLADAAYSQGYELLGVDIVAPRRPEIFAAFAIHSCDQIDYTSLIGNRRLAGVFHLAGAASVLQSVENPVGDFTSLLPGTVAVLAYLAQHQPRTHLILFSSAAVYGNPVHIPVSEDEVLAPISPYGIHKATAEFMAQKYGHLVGFPVTVLRIFSAYGIGLRRQVLWDITQQALSATRHGRPEIVLHGTGNETRDFIHAKDIARAALLMLNHPSQKGFQVVNLASGQETSIRQLAKLVCAALGSELKISYNGIVRPGDPINWQANVSLLSTFGFSPEIALADGVTTCVHWQQTLI